MRKSKTSATCQDAGLFVRRISLTHILSESNCVTSFSLHTPFTLRSPKTNFSAHLVFCCCRNVWYIFWRYILLLRVLGFCQCFSGCGDTDHSGNLTCIPRPLRSRRKQLSLAASSPAGGRKQLWVFFLYAALKWTVIIRLRKQTRGIEVALVVVCNL